MFGFYLIWNHFFDQTDVTGAQATLCALIILMGVQFLLFAMFFDMEESKNK